MVRTRWPKIRGLPFSIPVVITVVATLVTTTLVVTILLRRDAGAPDDVAAGLDYSYKSPEESMALVRIDPRFEVKLAASEPSIEEPVALAWDANGNLFVAEMRGFMQDLDGTGEDAPVGRVSCLRDLDGDGTYEWHAVFLDGLVLPRGVLPLDDRILVAEPPHLWLARDTDGDCRADEKVEIYDRYDQARFFKANPEHLENNPIWAMDNWIYSANSAVRLRFEDRKIKAEYTGGWRGQWGMTQDSFGNLLYTRSHSAMVGDILPEEALNFEGRFGKENIFDNMVLNPLYLEMPKFVGDFLEVWPAIPTVDVASPLPLRQDGTVRFFPSAGGAASYRGGLYPEDFSDNFFIPDAAARLVRRALVDRSQGWPALSNPYESSRGEFMASKDPNFRPVNSATGPNGDLYIVDMYRGVVQHKVAMQPGMPQYRMIKKTGLDKNIRRGRIFHVQFKGAKKAYGPPRLLGRSSSQLVDVLSHANGWWRDTAQKLLVLRKDRSVVPKLWRLFRTPADARFRLHYLWTLDGIAPLPATTVRAALVNESDPAILRALLRIAERHLARTDIFNLFVEIGGKIAPSDVATRVQLILSLRHAKQTEADRAMLAIGATDPHSPVVGNAVIAAAAGRERSLLRVLFDPKEPAPLFKVYPADVTRRVIVSAMMESARHQHTSFGWFADLADKQEGEGRNAVRLALQDAIDLASRFNGSDLAPELSWASAWLGVGGKDVAARESATHLQGRAVFLETCAACHGPNAQGIRGVAPSLATNQRTRGDRLYSLYVALGGLTGPLDAQEFPSMPPQTFPDDRSLAAVLTYVVKTYAGHDQAITLAEIKTARQETKRRQTPWTVGDLQKHLIARRSRGDFH